jgi:hypothetical protein
MIRVNVLITNISAERFWDIKKPIPPIQINTNINVVGLEKKTSDTLEVPFVLSINYNPSVAQISLKGIAVVQGETDEIEKLQKDFDQKKAPSQIIIQSISNVVFVESTIISKTLNIPPPIPLPQIPDSTKPGNPKPSGRDYSQ